MLLLPPAATFVRGKRETVHSAPRYYEFQYPRRCQRPDPRPNHQPTKSGRFIAAETIERKDSGSATTSCSCRHPKLIISELRVESAVEVWSNSPKRLQVPMGIAAQRNVQPFSRKEKLPAVKRGDHPTRFDCWESAKEQCVRYSRRSVDDEAHIATHWLFVARAADGDFPELKTSVPFQQRQPLTAPICPRSVAKKMTDRTDFAPRLRKDALTTKNEGHYDGASL